MKYKILAMVMSAALLAGCVGEVAFARDKVSETAEKSISVSAGDELADVSAGDGNEGIVTVDISTDILQNGGFLHGSSAEAATGTGEIQLPRYLAMGEEAYLSAESSLLEAYDSFAAVCDLSQYEIPISEVGAFVSDVLNANPRYFYASGEISAYSRDGCATMVLLQYNSEEGAAKEKLSAYDAAIAAFKKGVNQAWTDMEKALYINDYLARNCEYDLTYSKYTAYDALVNKTAVCQGYALAYKALAEEVDLECELITSWSLNHAWNMVKINGKYYHVDVTWNDPIYDMLGRARHQYLLKSTKYFKSAAGGHYVENDWTVDAGWKASYASSTTYDNYFWNEVDTGFEYIDGAWYNFDGADSIAKYTCNGKKFAKAGNLLKLDTVWYIPGSTAYYGRKYVGVASYNGNLYYSLDKAVYQYDFASATSGVVFELTESQQKTYNIYKLFINPQGEMYCYLAGRLGSADKIYKAMTIGKNTVKYNIRFDGNGASGGTMKAMTNRKYDTAYKLTANMFKRTGYVFTGWNTKADGTGKAYADKEKVSRLTGINGGTVTLYAQWSEPYISDTKLTMYVGSSYTLKLYGTAIKSTSAKKKNIAAVTAKGKVTAKKAGKTTITLTGKNGKTYKCAVTVKKPYISAARKALEKGQTFTLKLTGTSIKSAKSSNPAVATVTSKGKVTAQKKGKATITLKGKDKKNYQCVVTVK